MDESSTQIIGLTGGIGTGKSTVAAYLSSKGFPVIDADSIAHKIVLPGEPAYEKLINVFSRDILDDSQVIDRRKLGTIVFSDPEKLKKINLIMHPIIRSETDIEINKFKSLGYKTIFNDIPLLFENSLQNNFDLILVVYSSEEKQLERIVKRDSLSVQEAKARLSHQVSIEVKKQKADIVIENMSSKDELYREIDTFLKTL